MSQSPTVPGRVPIHSIDGNETGSRMKWQKSLVIVSSWILLTLSGCSDKPKLAQVTGNVTYKGQPVKQGSITFVPAEGRPATGKIVDGKITEITCYELNDGVPLGSHKVLIQAGQQSDDMYAPTAKSPIPERYASLEKSDLTAEIVAGENTVDFELK